MVTNIPVLTGTVLSKEATRGFIRYTMPGMLEEGFSGNKIMTVYRDAGYRFTDSWFWDTRRDILGIQKMAHTIQYVNPLTMPDPSKFAIPSFPLTTEYMFNATYNEYNMDTNILTKQTYSYKSNVLYSPDELERKMMNKLETDSPTLHLHRSGMRLVGAFRSG